MAVIQETIRAGRLVYRKITGKKASEKGKQRAKKSKPTIAEVERNNQRYAERDLMLKLNHNFSPNDMHLIFTYRAEPTKEEAAQILKEFKRKLLRLYRKYGVVLKWIETTEYENTRLHHHFIISQGVPLKEIKETWGHGTVITRDLYPEGDYRKLSEYIIKETSKSIKSDNPFSTKRFRCSRTIENPPVYREEVKASKLLEDPKPIKGYYIDRDSIYQGVNPVTERQYIEFFMLPIEGEEQAKKINGRKVKYRKESFDAWLRCNRDKQMELDIDALVAEGLSYAEDKGIW